MHHSLLRLLLAVIAYFLLVYDNHIHPFTYRYYSFFINRLLLLKLLSITYFRFVFIYFNLLGYFSLLAHIYLLSVTYLIMHGLNSPSHSPLHIFCKAVKTEQKAPSLHFHSDASA